MDLPQSSNRLCAELEYRIEQHAMSDARASCMDAPKDARCWRPLPNERKLYA